MNGPPIGLLIWEVADLKGIQINRESYVFGSARCRVDGSQSCAEKRATGRFSSPVAVTIGRDGWPPIASDTHTHG